MMPAVRDFLDALVGAAVFFAVQALVSEAPTADKEFNMPQTNQVPLATTLPRAEESTRDLLALVGVEVSADEIAEWSDWKLNKAEDWAGSVLLHKNAGTAPMPKPAFLNEYTTSTGEVRP